jgi:hypothetical protein
MHAAATSGNHDNKTQSLRGKKTSKMFPRRTNFTVGSSTSMMMMILVALSKWKGLKRACVASAVEETERVSRLLWLDEGV